MVTIGYSRLTEVIAKELWRDGPVRRRWSRPHRNEHAVRNLSSQLAGSRRCIWTPGPVRGVDRSLGRRRVVADEVKSYEKSDREVHFDRQTGKMLGWFIEHRPSRVTRLFGTIIGRAETELDVPREMTTRSLRSSIRMDGGFGEKTDRLDEFLDLVSPPRR
jgi:hypothetical protein